MDEKRAGTIAELRAALAELASDEGLWRFVEGHGLQSRFFAFSWRSDGLAIDFRLPYARVLSDEDDQRIDAVRIGAAIRMAVMLLVASGDGSLLLDGEETISVEADESGVRYSIANLEGDVMDACEDWEPLIARLETAVSDGDGDVQIIWP